MASISINNNLNKIVIFSANSSWYLFNFRINTIKAFINNGYTVYSMDLLGFGESDQPGIKEIGKLDNGIWCDQVTDFIIDIIRPINTNKI